MTVWNQRYSSEEYAFGKEPNVYFKSVIDHHPPGKLLVPGAGEGRDAVYAATLGWEVFAFDASDIGQGKALRLARDKGVSVNYEVSDAAHFDFSQDQYDMIAMTFFHLPVDLRRHFFGNLYQTLKPEGIVVVEAFNPLQLNYSSGGPKDINMLLTKEILEAELKHIKCIQCYEQRVTLNEGAFHQGQAEVLRFTGRRLPLSV
ncbi:MAG: class I SAM-dependent methyltransferase [Bacteroidales bacterium]